LRPFGKGLRKQRGYGKEFVDAYADMTIVKPPSCLAFGFEEKNGHDYR
jgi:hypothetical protein